MIISSGTTSRTRGALSSCSWVSHVMGGRPGRSQTETLFLRAKSNNLAMVMTPQMIYTDEHGASTGRGRTLAYG